MSFMLRASLFLITIGTVAIAADDGPRLENALPVTPMREGGPLYLTGEIGWDRPELFEGRMRFVLRDGPEILSIVETDPIVAAAGSTRFRQLLPVQQSLGSFGMSDVDVSFLTEADAYPPKEIGVLQPRPGEWNVVLLSAEPTYGAGLSSAERVREALVFENAFENPREFGIRTYLGTVPALEFPEQPLAYCAFDAILLPSTAFARLNGRQLEAIEKWTRAGGAVCVLVEGPLESKQVEFLNALFRDTGIAPFLPDEGGRVAAPAEASGGILDRRVGMGHAIALFGSPADVDVSQAAWRKAQARFWRLREQYVTQIEQEPAIRKSLFEPQTATPGVDPIVRTPMNRYEQFQQNPFTWSYPAPAFGTALIDTLRPSDIRLMPGWTVLLILFGYVAVVGPLDYFVLGWFRMRKWTWLTFPAVTLAITGGVVATANAFMSGNDHARRVEIIDLDAHGEPVRRTTLELLFRGSSEPVVHELKQALFTRVDQSHFHTHNPFFPPGTQSNVVTSNQAPTGPYRGTLPSRYVVPQRIAKWTPQLNRTFEIAPQVRMPKLDWPRLEQQNPGVVSLPGGQTAHLLRVSHGKVEGPQALLGTVQTMALMPLAPNGMIGPGRTATTVQTSVPTLQAATASPQQERFLIQFQRSPLGLGRLDDLPFVDATARSETGVLVWTEDRDGNVLVYRKLIRNSSDQDRETKS